MTRVITITGDPTTREVHVDGVRLDPQPSQKVWNHSPDGFAWGYAGSGPAQLALALLLHGGLDHRKAVYFHQRLKFDLVASLPFDQPFLVDFDLAGWIERQA